MSKNSKEYQGHGWGSSYFKNNKWLHYKNIIPIWEDDLSKFGKTNTLVAHARSAFMDEGILIENNMPFYDGRYTFIFNGELRGVKIKSEGRIGAEKIFNYIKRFDKGNIHDAIEKAVGIINKMTEHIRAMNFIVYDGQSAYVYSQFSEEADYFTMYYRTSPDLIICSMPLCEENDWKPIKNKSLTQF